MRRILFVVAVAATLVALAPRQASAQIVLQIGGPRYAAPTYGYGYPSYYSPGYSSYNYTPASYSYGYSQGYYDTQSYVPYSYGYYQTAPSYYYGSSSYIGIGGYRTYGGQGWVRPSFRRWR